MTPKQRVRKKYPKAFSMKRPFGTVIYREYAYGAELGCAVTALGAWRAAARRMRHDDIPQGKINQGESK